MDRQVLANQPDIVVIDKDQMTTMVIDVDVKWQQHQKEGLWVAGDLPGRAKRTRKDVESKGQNGPSAGMSSQGCNS